MNSTPVVSIEKLNFSYGEESLFKDLNLNISSNQFIGVVGSNGAGKSTLLKIILGFIKPQSGNIEILSRKPGDFELKNQVSTSMQNIDFPAQLKVKELISFVTRQYKDSIPANTLIKDFDITDFKDKNCGSLSGGMKRRISLACAFAGKPKLSILDEPSTGLDVSSRKKMISTVSNYCKEHDSTVIMISHHPEEMIHDVDTYLHLKSGGNINYISPEKMEKVSLAKKVTFSSQEDLHFTKVIQFENINNDYKVITENSDTFIKDLNNKTQGYSQLRINNLNSAEIMSFFS